MQAIDLRTRVGILLVVGFALLISAPRAFAADKPTLGSSAKPAAPATPSPSAPAQAEPEKPAPPASPASPSAPAAAPVKPAASSITPATRPSTPTPADRTSASAPGKTPTLTPATGTSTPATRNSAPATPPERPAPSQPGASHPSTPSTPPSSAPLVAPTTPHVRTPTSSPSAPRHAGEPAGTTHPVRPSPRGAQAVETPPVERAPSEPPQTTSSPIPPRHAQPVDTPRAPIAGPVAMPTPRTGVPTASPRPPGWPRWPNGGGPADGPPIIVRVHPRHGYHDFPWCGNGCPPCGTGRWPAEIPALVIVESTHLSGQQEYSEIVYTCAAGLARVDHPNGVVLLDEKTRLVSFYDQTADEWTEESLDAWSASVDSIVWWTRAHSRPSYTTFEASGETILVAEFECTPYRVSVEVDDGDRVVQIAQAVWVTRDVEVTPEVYATYRNMQRLFDDQWLDVCADRPQGFVFRTRCVRLPVPLEEGESAEIAEATVTDIGYRLVPLSFFQNPMTERPKFIAEGVHPDW